MSQIQLVLQTRFELAIYSPLLPCKLSLQGCDLVKVLESSAARVSKLGSGKELKLWESGHARRVERNTSGCRSSSASLTLMPSVSSSMFTGDRDSEVRETALGVATK